MISLFGPYRQTVDWILHVFWSFVVTIIGYKLGLSFDDAVIVFASALLLDLDHLLNPPIARWLNIDSHFDSWKFGSNGYTIKILHGFDVSALIGWIAAELTDRPLFGIMMGVNLAVHEIWDFLVCPHGIRELLLVTRMRNKFKPGYRTWFVGHIFDLHSVRH